MQQAKIKVGISFILMAVIMLIGHQFLLFINLSMALILHEMAHIYMAKGDTLAKSFYKEAMAVDPDNYYLIYDYAMYLQENGFPEEALSCYDSLLNIMPDNTDFIYNNGYVYLVYLGDNDEALRCFDKLEEDVYPLDVLNYFLKNVIIALGYAPNVKGCINCNNKNNLISFDFE